MDFAFTDEQALLRDSLARYLERNSGFDARRATLQSGAPYSTDVWRHFVDLGLLAAPFPEGAGGLGGSIVDVVAICEVFGEHLVSEPYLSSVLLAGKALAAGDSGRGRAWLARILEGRATAAFAHEEGRGTPDASLVALTAVPVGRGYRLDGDKRLVLGGAEADLLVVSARLASDPGDDDGLALFLVDPAVQGVALTRFTTLDGRSAAHLRLDRVEVPAQGLLVRDAGPLIRAIVGEATIALGAEAVGAMGALLRQTCAYASTRKQFGVPLSQFQVVAHRLADMKIAWVKARATMLYTAALGEAGRAGPHDVSLFKAQVGRLGRRIGEAAIQTHGGIGMTDELPVGHYFKRLLAIDAMFGASEHHLRRVGAGTAGPRAATYA